MAVAADVAVVVVEAAVEVEVLAMVEVFVQPQN
jgi:hypothetical protein